MKTLPHGFYKAIVDSVWEQEGRYGSMWRWNFVIRHDGWTYRVSAFTSASLWNEKTRSYLSAVLERSVEPKEEFYASSFGGESCTLQVGTMQKNGRTFNTVESIL